MTKYSGLNGYVEVSASVVAGIRDWSVDLTRNTVETTDFNASGNASFVAGVQSWSGNFTGFKDGIPLSLNTDTVSVRLALTSVSTEAFYGQVFITGMHAGAAVDGAGTMSYDFQGTGALTLPAS